jgi:hypothetical protein
VPPYAPPPYPPYQDRNGPLLRGDPLLDRPFSPPPGWFAGVEADILVPHIKNRLTANVNVGGLFTDTVHLPTAELDAVAAPRIELGYRFAEGCGEVLAAYRSLVTDSTAIIPGFDALGDGGLRSRLDVNVLDLDYASREYSLAPCWNLNWFIGARLADIYFDSRAEGLFMEQRTSNHFLGAGPHAGLELWRRLDARGVALYGRVEGAVVIGRVHQSFEETFTDNGVPFAGGATSQSTTQAVPVVSAELGLGWVPPWSNWLRLTGGYHIEHWWDLGQVANSRAELGAQGVFLRAEFSF